MKLVIFGLSISSSWGNGHATLWRGLCKELHVRGHEAVFFERDMPYYASNRDMTEIVGCDLRLYVSWTEVLPAARREIAEADVAIVTSYCPDSLHASDLVSGSDVSIRCFYDLDTPITLARWRRGECVEYVPPSGYRGFDLVLSYTGGRSLELLRECLGARNVAPLYGSVDPHVHKPARSNPGFEADLSYLGTYAAERQQTLSDLFIEPARQRPDLRFVIGGAQYPNDFPWTSNIYFVRHLPAAQHPDFYCSSRATLNVTRRPMVELGFCPPGRLFEAAACGAAILTDEWEGLGDFYEPGAQVLLCRTYQDVLDSLALDESELKRIGRQARERTLDQHTAMHRAAQLEKILEGAASPAGIA